MVARLLISLIAIPALLGIAILGELWFVLLVTFIGLLGLYEVYRIIGLLSIKAYYLPGFMALLALLGNAYCDYVPYFSIVILFIVVTILWHLVSVVIRRFRIIKSASSRNSAGIKINRAIFTILGSLYMGWPLSLAISLREGTDGIYWILLVMLGTFTTDTASFCVGKIIGRHQLAPIISPSKTVEGALGGVVVGVIGILIMLDTFNLELHSVSVAVLFSVLFTISAQIGDLLESMLKRKAFIKDSGSIVPGHGGVLDRLDSVVLVLLFVYYSRSWVIS